MTPPFLKSTVPPPSVGETVAVSVTDWPKLLGFGDEPSTVLVGVTTTCVVTPCEPM